MTVGVKSNKDNFYDGYGFLFSSRCNIKHRNIFTNIIIICYTRFGITQYSLLIAETTMWSLDIKSAKRLSNFF